MRGSIPGAGSQLFPRRAVLHKDDSTGCRGRPGCESARAPDLDRSRPGSRCRGTSRGRRSSMQRTPGDCGPAGRPVPAGLRPLAAAGSANSPRQETGASGAAGATSQSSSRGRRNAARRRASRAEPASGRPRPRRGTAASRPSCGSRGSGARASGPSSARARRSALGAPAPPATGCPRSALPALCHNAYRLVQSTPPLQLVGLRVKH